VASISQLYYKNRLLLYVEFADMAGVVNFRSHMTDGALVSESGTIYILIDKEDTIATLQGVKHAISDEDILHDMSEYGEVRAIYRGFHSLGCQSIDNGKRYIVYTGPCAKQIPTYLQVNHETIHVRYSGTPSLTTHVIHPCSNQPEHIPQRPLFAEIYSPMMSYINNETPLSAGINCPPTVHLPGINETVFMGNHEIPSTSSVPQVTCPVWDRATQTDTSGTKYSNTATNTDNPTLVDAYVQRNNHVKKKLTQTDSLSTQNVKIQCQILPTAVHVSTQTLSLYNQVQEYRQLPRRKIIPYKKRKRVSSGQTCSIPRDLKSPKCSSETLHKYFESNKPRLSSNTSDSPSEPQCSLCAASYASKFMPKMSGETLGALICWKCDQIDSKLQRPVTSIRTGEG
jgi:hypothetical protein